MNITAAICAHPVRTEYAELLQQRLDQPTPIVYDTNPVPSANALQRWLTHQRAWQAAYDAGGDACMVIQDDAIVCRDLIRGLGERLDELGDDFLVSPYTGTGRPDQPHIRRALANATTTGARWITTRSLCWGVSLVLPRRVVPDMLAAVDKHVRRSRPPKSNTDYAIGVWVRDALEWPSTYSVPSLVDHRQVPSLVGHDRGPARMAHNFIGEDASALGYFRDSDPA